MTTLFVCLTDRMRIMDLTKKSVIQVNMSGISMAAFLLKVCLLRWKSDSNLHMTTGKCSLFGDKIEKEPEERYTFIIHSLFVF